MIRRSQGATTPTPRPAPRPRRHARSLILATLLAVCGACEEAPAADCDIDACPPGDICGEHGCEPVTPPAETGELGRHTVTALASNDRLVIATYDATHKNLVVGVEGAGATFDQRIVDGWHLDGRQVVETDAGRWAALAIDAEDTLHLAWFDADRGALRYGRGGLTGDFALEDVDGLGPEVRGTHASIALREGIVHLAYRDETARALRHARRELDGTWTTRRIDPCAGEADCPAEGLEDYGEWARITVIGQSPRIAFYDRYRGDLKMAHRHSGGVWEVTTLDGRDAATGADTGDVGRFISLALTPERHPGLAYYDATRGTLRYLVPGTPPMVVDGGVFEDVDRQASARQPVGQHVRLRYTPGGRAVMLYLDAGALTLRQALVSGGNVLITRGVEGLAPGGYIDFVVDSDGELRGAYGAWVAGDAPRTELVRFHLPAQVPR